ncbi:protein FAM81A-like isoform X1 [Apostichopus japonicus]|uniref:protein FAM81A-like isoform X1 n=1 Tax=Stichopus japonicus TaxID=307972 RepID=UPI003AB3E1A0
MSHNHQQSSVLPLLSWPTQPVRHNTTTNVKSDRIRSPDIQDDRLVARINSTVRSSKDWVQRADELKDEAGELMSSRSPSYEVWQDRRISRLLEEHSHSVTMALKKLSAEVANLQAQVSGRDKADLLTGNSIKHLELQQASSVQDIRSRVGRCDASIAVISSDIRSLAESLSAVNRQVNTLSDAMEKGSKVTDQKVSRMQVDIQERTKQELEKKSVTEDKLEEKVTSWEFKTKSQLKEIHNNIQALQTESQAKQKKLKQELAHTMEQLHGQNQQKQTQFERAISERLNPMENAVARLQRVQDSMREVAEDQQRELKSNLNRQLSKMEENLMGVIRVEVEDIKSSLHSALGTTQSNMETMRKVLEGKQRLSEEALRKEIARMKKLVVLT